jgi:hypothetical protein
VPLDAFDVPSVAGKDALLSALRERPDPYRRVITGSGKLCVIWRQTDHWHVVHAMR